MFILNSKLAEAMRFYGYFKLLIIPLHYNAVRIWIIFHIDVIIRKYQNDYDIYLFCVVTRISIN